MKIKFEFIKTIIYIVIVAFFLLLIISWISINPTKNFTENIPGMDNREEIASTQKKNVRIGEFFSKGDGVPSKIQGSFDRFRGKNFNNIVDDKILSDWNVNKPLKLWEIDLGEGYASPVVKNGMVYILDYNEEKKSDSLLCLSLDDGKKIWECSYKVPVKRNHGMSRTVSAVTDKYVVSIGPRCHVMCLDSRTGNFLWGLDLVKDFGAAEPLWYTGQCPLIDGDLAIIGVGGNSLMIAVDCKSGKVIWQTPNPDNWKMTHSSVMPMTIDKTKMYVYCTTGGIVGVDGNGSVLWKSDSWAHSIIVPSPVDCGNGRIFLTSGYGAGSRMLQVYKENSLFKTTVLFDYKPDKGLAGEQQTPIFYKGFLYGINPDDGGIYKNQLVCSDINGKIIWQSGLKYKFGLGPYMIIDDKILLLTENGTLNMIEASNKNFKLLGSIKILDGVEAWAPLCYVSGRLLVRDSKKMICLKLK